MSLAITPISREAFEAALNSAPSVPELSESFTHNDFDAEYWGLHRNLLTALSEMGRHEIAGDGDFTLNDDAPLARSLGLALTSKKMWNASLIEKIQDTIRTSPFEYRVYVDHTLLDEPDFFLLVYPDRAIGWFEDKELHHIFNEVEGK